MTINASFKMTTNKGALSKKLDTAISSKGEATSIMRGWGGRVQNRMQTYPGQVKNYRRTGNYGRGFRSKVEIGSNSITAIVTNPVEYATYVGGERQRGYHAAHGWQNIDIVAREEWDVTLARLKKLYEG